MARLVVKVLPPPLPSSPDSFVTVMHAIAGRKTASTHRANRVKRWVMARSPWNSEDL
jgi:hypothetical protein